MCIFMGVALENTTTSIQIFKKSRPQRISTETADEPFCEKEKKKGTGELYILEHKALRAVLHHFFCSTIRRFKLLWVKLAISGKMFKATRRMLKEFLRSSGTFTRLFL